MLPVASAFLYAFRAGVTVLLYREREPRFRPEQWLRLIGKHRVTDLIGTPTIYRMLLTVENGDRFDTSSLVRGTSAGEPLPPDTFARVKERFGFPPLDGIGMSECMVYAHNFADDPRPGSCGRPGRGLELAVLDEDLRPVAPGEPGVLCVKRDTHQGMMREYLNKPERTAEVLRGPWYVSGDVVRETDGAFEFVGRADDVMKCSGYRISPFEVESALNSHPAVLEAAAVESRDELRGNVVKGVCTLREGFAPGPALEQELIAHVKARLAPFKAPRRVEFVAQLPKTESGKIKRRLLRG
jgi:acyl-coenzyme A synthetase/AMP-(fatty) acid ligase